MIKINVHIIFFALHELIATRIVYHISYQCAIMLEITLHITLLGCICKLIEIAIVLHVSYQYAIMSEISLNVHYMVLPVIDY